MDALCKATLAYGLVPPVVTEFPGITVGGAVMGGALESSSFLHGHFADALIEFEFVLPSGQVIIANAKNGHSDLFWGIRGSYGTLGRLTLCTLRLERAAPDKLGIASMPNETFFERREDRAVPEETVAETILSFPFDSLGVQIDFFHVSTISDTVQIMQHASDSGTTGIYHYIDAIAFRDNELNGRCVVLMAARRITRQSTNVPSSRSGDWFERRVRQRLLTFLRHQKSKKIPEMQDTKRPSIQSTTGKTFYAFCSEDYLLWDYLFRYDRGAFWMGLYMMPCFCNLPLPSRLQDMASKVCVDGTSPILRETFAAAGGLDTTRNLYRSLHLAGQEFVQAQFSIHDFHIPGENVLSFVSWIDSYMDISPLWLCPVARAQGTLQQLSCHYVPNSHFTPCEAKLGCWLCQNNIIKNSTDIVVNVGVYGNNPPGIDVVKVNKKMEDKAMKLGGRKLLYSQLHQKKHVFWSVYDQAWYTRLREKYLQDEQKYFPDLHEKLTVHCP